MGLRHLRKIEEFIFPLTTDLAVGNSILAHSLYNVSVMLKVVLKRIVVNQNMDN